MGYIPILTMELLSYEPLSGKNSGPLIMENKNTRKKIENIARVSLVFKSLPIGNTCNGCWRDYQLFSKKHQQVSTDHPVHD